MLYEASLIVKIKLLQALRYRNHQCRPSQKNDLEAIAIRPRASCIPPKKLNRWVNIYLLLTRRNYSIACEPDALPPVEVMNTYSK